MLAEAELFLQFDSWGWGDPLKRILFQAPVLTGSEMLFPPIVSSSLGGGVGWGNGFCCYYPGGLSLLPSALPTLSKLTL